MQYILFDWFDYFDAAAVFISTSRCLKYGQARLLDKNIWAAYVCMGFYQNKTATLITRTAF